MLYWKCIDEEKIYGYFKRANGWCKFVIEIYGGTSEQNRIEIKVDNIFILSIRVESRKLL